MLEMVKKFPAQLREAMEIGEKALIDPISGKCSHVYVSGMGGSGIGADFVSSFIKSSCKIPYLVNKTYEAPAYINEDSIVIASSYSGNTEETITNLTQCIHQKARIICIASGGKVIELAKKNGFNYIQVPDHWSSPRACLGYSLVAQLFVLFKLDLIGSEFKVQLQNSIHLLELETKAIQEKAKHLAQSLFKKLCIIYCTDRIEPVAVRFRQQINENAKRLCWHHVIPEMNHNELVGWRESRSEYCVIFLRNANDYERNKTRIELTKEVVGTFAGSCIEVFSKGDSIIERSLYLVHLLDYTSVYLAELNQVDSVEVKVIDYLKSSLSDSN